MKGVGEVCEANCIIFDIKRAVAIPVNMNNRVGTNKVLNEAGDVVMAV